MRKLVAIILSLMFCSCAFEEPQFITVDVYNCDRIAIDGNFVELSSSNDEFVELKSVIFSKSKDLDFSTTF